MADDKTDQKKGTFSGAFKNLGFASRLTGNSPGGLPPVKTHQLTPQDSIPEIVSSPTDVGIFDGGHQGDKITWAKFFEDGKQRRASMEAQMDAARNAGGPGPSPK